MTKRTNKTKEEIKGDLEHIQKVKHHKELADRLWKHIEPQLSIYDAQTVLSAAAGFLELELIKKTKAFKVSDCPIDLSKEKPSLIKTGIEGLVRDVQDEELKDTVEFLKKFSDTLSHYGASQYLRNGMDKVKKSDIIA